MYSASVTINKSQTFKALPPTWSHAHTFKRTNQTRGDIAKKKPSFFVARCSSQFIQNEERKRAANYQFRLKDRVLQVNIETKKKAIKFVWKSMILHAE